MSELKDSLRTFEAALKSAKDDPDAYADEVKDFATKKLKPLLKEVENLYAKGKRMNLRYEYDRLNRLIGPLETAVEDLEEL